MNSLRFAQSRKGFTLAEITICLAIIATALVAILGVLPSGLNTSRKAMDHTVVATVLEDVYNRIQGTALTSAPDSELGQDIDFHPETQQEIEPAFYDASGTYLDPKLGEEELIERRVYRVDAFTSSFANRPEHTSQLRPLTIALSWPIDARTGEAKGRALDKVLFTFGVTPLTGTDWTQIDPNYVPRIEY